MLQVNRLHEISIHQGFKLAQTKSWREREKWEVLWRSKNLLRQLLTMVPKARIMGELSLITSQWKVLRICHSTTQANSFTRSLHHPNTIHSCNLKCNIQWQTWIIKCSNSSLHQTMEIQVHTQNIWKDLKKQTFHQFRNSRTDLTGSKIPQISIWRIT